MAQNTLKVGSTVKEIKWMGQFARNAVLVIVKIKGDSVLLADADGDELWDDITNVTPVESSVNTNLCYGG